MKKIRIKSEKARYLGEDLVKGDEVEVEDRIASIWIATGRAESVTDGTKPGNKEETGEAGNTEESSTGDVKAAKDEDKKPQTKADKKPGNKR